MNIHEETLKIARNLIKKDPSLTDWVISKFPELRESEGERIRKYILDFININKGVNLSPDDADEMLAWLEKQGEQKPADKFEIGDLITNGILVGKIDEIHEWGCHAYFGDYYADVPDAENWHKWTIQDAKDGDILFTSSTASHETFIFKSIDEKGNAKCYFAYDSEDGFREGKYHFIGRATNCKPATKEQRDTLERAMTNAGYKWDAEKKLLKKIEKKQAWSKEDESWFKELELMALSFSNDDSYRKKFFDWLKSLKDRYTWKPSDKQMKQLGWIAEQNKGNMIGKELMTLYQDLKKLREE